MLRTRSLLPAAALLALGLGACTSHRHTRIAEHAAVFATLPSEDQERIREGLVDLGYRHEAVYMALGRPSRILRAAGPDDAQTWVYHNFVYGTSAAMVAATPVGARYGGTQVVAGPVRGGATSVPRGSPTGMIDTSTTGTGTLLVDLVEGAVVRIRLEP